MRTLLNSESLMEAITNKARLFPSSAIRSSSVKVMLLIESSDTMDTCSTTEDDGTIRTSDNILLRATNVFERVSEFVEFYVAITKLVKFSTSSSSDYSSISSDEDSKAYAAKLRAKMNYVEGAKASIPLNDLRISYEELMKRKAQDDEMEDRRRRKDRIRRRIQAAEERRRFVDGVPSDSDANASEEETIEAELEDEYEAEDDSDSDDPNIHPDFINGRDSDSDEELEEDSANDDDDESHNSDKSDDSDESDN
ncbi:ribosomal L1 domain-containing protein CG13096-like [Papaver somniferum]|uniref:ribosomal L1 domain-containing protein CG13096-like n=1 Tax=Papaver somniferum TaxID=3469 RepID=UPI000E70456E|nr:ribosomal L1 domain-containing protein CG13096-like [Papaver somniferum]